MSLLWILLFVIGSLYSEQVGKAKY